MNVSTEQLELVVREVMRRIASSQPDEANSVGAGDLHVDERVVTTATLDNRISGMVRVVVRPDAIVTPAVVDELKDKSIELVRCTTTLSSKSVASVLLVNATNQPNNETFITQIRNSGAKLRTATLANCEQLGGNMRSHEIAVVLAEKPFEAACLANRDARVCAVYPMDSRQCAAALAEVKANVLVVDSNRIDATVISTFLAMTRD